MHLLREISAQPSAVYDMESFFWTFLYALLHQEGENLGGKDKAILERLNPKNGRDYIGDADTKTGVLTDLLDVESVAFDGVLDPYRHLISEVADLAFSFDQKTKGKTFKGYDSKAEGAAIQDCISAFEQFLNLQKKRSG